MSLHNKPEFNTPALIAALKEAGLKHDKPSQLADGFRVGWFAALAEREADGWNYNMEDAPMDGTEADLLWEWSGGGMQRFTDCYWGKDECTGEVGWVNKQRFAEEPWDDADQLVERDITGKIIAFKLITLPPAKETE
jgi:hypothetical protein